MEPGLEQYCIAANATTAAGKFLPTDGWQGPAILEPATRCYEEASAPG